MRLIIDSLTIDMVRNYLEKTGWIIGGEWHKPATMWHFPNDKYAQIILPNSSDLADYKRAMRRVIEELSEVEKRHVDDILLSIQQREHINIRVISDDVAGGEIPILDGANLFKGAYDLVKATAESVFKANKDQSKKVSIDNYMKSVRLGQTAVGSYLVNVYSPMISSENSQQKDCIEPSAVISSALISSLRNLKASLDKYERTENISVFQDVGDKKLSENLCNALINIGGEIGRSIEIQAGELTKDKEARDNVAITFESNYLSSIDRVLEHFKQIEEELNDYEIVGKIIGLQRVPENDFGKVTIQTYIEDKPKNVTVYLTGIEYDKAIKAHEEKSNILCIGNVEVKKKSAIITEVKVFRPLDTTLKL